MMIRHLTILGMLMCGLAAAGCGGGSSTNPQSSQAYLQGAHLDSLAVQAANGGFFDRYRLLAYPTAALIQNLTPSKVTVGVDGSNQTYEGVVLELVGTTAGSNPTPSDSIYAISVWNDSSVDELVFTQIALPDTLEDAENLTGTVTNPAFDSAKVLSVSLPSTPNHCHLFTLPEPNSAVESLTANTTCSQGTATAAFSLYFTAGASNPHSVFTMASQSVNAVRIVLPANTGGTERIRSLLARPRHMRRPASSF
jgi:hypothetical protein